MDSIERRLEEKGIVLPPAAKPAANYLPYVLHNGTLYVSGQLPISGGAVAHRGRLGDALGMEEARDAARLCVVNVLAQAKAALAGDLERIRRVLRITAFVASTPDFSEHHLVANGASDFLADVLGERGQHARAAVGVVALPLGAPVEIDAIIAVSGDGH